MIVRNASGVALVLALALAVPMPAAAKTHSKKSPKTGSVVVVLKGLPKKKKATATVTGPASFSKTRKAKRSFTLKGLRPGTYVAAGKTFKFQNRYYSTSNASGVVFKNRKRVLKLIYAPSKTDPNAGPPVNPTPFDAVAPAAGITLASHDPSGGAGNGDSAYPSFAPDGSLYFSSCASSLTGDTDACFAYRSVGGTISRITGAFLGTDIIDWGGQTTVSPDGSKLGFTTLVRLVPNDTDDNKDLYSLNLSDKTVQRVSQAPDGSGMAGGEVSPNTATNPTWSPDSTRMGFVTQSTNLAPKNDNYDDLFLRTLGARDFRRIGVGRTIYKATWSPDGGSVAFDGVDEYSLADVEIDSHVYVASSTGGAPWKFTTDGQSFDPAWSPTGGRIAFTSISPLAAGDDNQTSDIYVKDVASGVISRVSVDSAGKQTGWACAAPVWSPDGSKIAFVAQDGDYGQTVMVKNLATGTMTQVFSPSAAGGGADSDYIVGHLAFSADSSRLAFDSDYPGITAGDGNGSLDVFVATL